jgi:hypothetical protein
MHIDARDDGSMSVFYGSDTGPGGPVTGREWQGTVCGVRREDVKLGLDLASGFAPPYDGWSRSLRSCWHDPVADELRFCFIDRPPGEGEDVDRQQD